MKTIGKFAVAATLALLAASGVYAAEFTKGTVKK